MKQRESHVIFVLLTFYNLLKRFSDSVHAHETETAVHFWKSSLTSELAGNDLKMHLILSFLKYFNLQEVKSFPVGAVLQLVSEPLSAFCSPLLRFVSSNP